MSNQRSLSYRRRAMPAFLMPAIWLVMVGLGVPIMKLASLTGQTARLMKQIWKLGEPQRRIARTFGSYLPTSADILVCTYFKSGTNWMMQIAHQIVHRGKGEYGHIHDVIPWPEMKIPGFAVDLRHPHPLASSPTGLRVIKTHMPASNVPITEDAHSITVIRDPKDVFVSSYHFARSIGFGPLLPTLEDWLDVFLDENFILGGSWAVHTAGYWALRNRPNVKICSFKHMKRNLEQTIADLSGWLGVDLRKSEFEEVVYKSGFDFMKTIDHKFHPGRMTPFSEAGGMMRRGSHGSSSELLTIAQQRRIDRYFQDALKRQGCSDFPYEFFCDPV